MRPLVVVESPYAGKTPADIERHLAYARAALRDCLERGEAPFASHLLYTQPGVLKDNVPAERSLGMQAGFAVARAAAVTAVYCDYGVSQGMYLGIGDAIRHGRRVEYRRLYVEDK